MTGRRLLIAVKVVVASLGAALCVRLIASVGWDLVGKSLRNHAGALAIITITYVLFHLVRTWALMICIPQRTRFRDVFGIRLAGEAIAYIAVGSILGDTIKVALGRHRISVVESATGVFAEKIIYHLAGAGFIIGGLLAAVIRFGTSRALLYGLVIMLALFTGLLFLLSSGLKPVTWILRPIRVRRPKLREAILRVEESLFRFRKDHPGRFLLVFALDVFSYFFSAAQVYYLLWMFGFAPDVLDLWYFQSVIQITNTAGMIVPANLGVFEATNLFLARQLHYGDPVGILLGLFVRLRSIFWALLGYLWFLFLL